jgi:hypothetical protein
MLGIEGHPVPAHEGPDLAQQRFVQGRQAAQGERQAMTDEGVAFSKVNCFTEVK